MNQQFLYDSLNTLPSVLHFLKPGEQAKAFVITYYDANGFYLIRFVKF